MTGMRILLLVERVALLVAVGAHRTYGIGGILDGDLVLKVGGHWKAGNWGRGLPGSKDGLAAPNKLFGV